MMLYPSIVELLEKAGNKYSLVIAAAKRAREICAEGTDEDERLDGASGLTRAAQQIADGSVKVIAYKGKDAIVEKVLANAQEDYIDIFHPNVHDDDEEDTETDTETETDTDTEHEED